MEVLMKKNLKYVYYRHPRTRAEARANQEGWERPSRRPHLLPTNYDDIYPTKEKSWKAKRKTQYHTGGRGKEHSIIVDADFTYEWDLTDYFKKYDIPYRVEHIRESKMKKFRKWKRVSIGHWPVYRTEHYRNEEGKLVWVSKFSHHSEKFEWVEDGWEWKNVSVLIAYKIIWWYNKDIGIDYILKQCRPRRIY